MTSSSTAHLADFVRVDGVRFSRRGKPYFIAGANLWYAGYLGAPEGVGDRARLRKELDNLRAIGVNNVRVLAVSEASAMKSAMRPATTSAPGQYDENLLTGLDFLMAELAKRDMTAVIYLNNFWQWSGGMTQYVNWFTGTPALDFNETGDQPAFIANSARFYGVQAAQEEFRNVIRTLVNRVNTVTGTAYRDDPAVMSWQLANEPRPGVDFQTTDEAKALYAQWVGAVAEYIHELDPNHLVSSGSEGRAGSAQDDALYVAAHRTPHIDYLTFHLWPKNWFWFDSRRIDETWDAGIANCRDYLDAHLAMAKQLGKPIVLEEFGMDRDGVTFDIKATTHVRDRFYREVFEFVDRSAQAGDPAAGWCFWAWGGSGRAGQSDYWWRPGDDFLGDPPQEEQGLYSVFDSDVTSLVLIKEFADRFKALQT